MKDAGAPASYKGFPLRGKRYLLEGAYGTVRSHLSELAVCLALLLATLLINFRLIRDGITGLGDVRWHLTWLQHFSIQFSEGTAYPRWLAGTNFGYGSPTFVFYPPLVYFAGALVRAMGFTFEQMVNILFASGVFFSGVSFYCFGRFRWGRWPGFFGALTYMLSPGLLGVWHGGGLAPLYSFVWLPLLLLFTEKGLRDIRYRAVLTVVWGLVALTHLPSLLIYAIAFVPYALYKLRSQPWTLKLQIWLCPLLGWGLAAFFLIPAVLEQRYINIDYMLASQDGFEASMMSVADAVREGWGSRTVQQWVACGVFGAIASFGYFSQPKQQRKVMATLFVAVGVAFLISDWSWPLWKIAPVVKKIEYSTRINRLLYLAQAALCAMAVHSMQHPKWKLRGMGQRIVQIALLTVVCAILFSNFKAHHAEVKKFPGLYSSGNGVMLNREWIEMIVHDPFRDRLIDVPEYRPRLSSEEPQTFVKEVQTGAGLPEVKTTVSGSLPTPQPNQPRFEVVEGNAVVNVLAWERDRRSLQIDAKTDSSVILRVYNYPAWKLSVDGERHNTRTAYDGRVQFDLAAGSHKVILRYGMTPAFWLGIVASVLSAIAFVGIYCYRPWIFN